MNVDLLINTAGYHRKDAFKPLRNNYFFDAINNPFAKYVFHIKIRPLNIDGRFHTFPLGEVGLIPM